MITTNVTTWRRACLAAILLFPVSVFAASVTPIALGTGTKRCTDVTIDGHTSAGLTGNQQDGTTVTNSGNSDGYVFTTNFTSSTGLLNWSVSAGAGVVPGIDAVLVKGQSGTNAYVYDPITTPLDFETDATSDTGLVAICNNSPCPVTAITFCYDYHLTVSKTANATYDRTYTWSISKSVDQTSLSLIQGNTGDVHYTVGVTKSAPVDSNFAVSGAVTIVNQSPFTATISGVNDSLAGSAVTVNCGVTFPHMLATAATLTCPYSVAVADTTTRINVAGLTTTGDVGGGGTATATATFGDPTNIYNNSLSVSDTNGQSWTTSTSNSWMYTETFSCGTPSPYTNTASIVPSTASGANPSSATAMVTITCSNPVGGCTLSQGYWKTHSSYGPAPSDPTWNDNPPGGPDAAFFSSGTSWLGALQTDPSGGNAYWTLAHQYIAAILNEDNGASVPGPVASAISDALSLFGTYTPAQVGALSGNDSTRQQFIADATLLDTYNNGLYSGGPPACTDNSAPQ